MRLFRVGLLTLILQVLCSWLDMKLIRVVVQERVMDVENYERSSGLRNEK